MLFNKALGIVVDKNKQAGVIYLSKKCDIEIKLDTGELNKYFFNVLYTKTGEIKLFGVKDTNVPFVSRSLIGLNNKIIILFIRMKNNIKNFAVLLPNGKRYYSTEAELLKLLAYKTEFSLSNAIVQDGHIIPLFGYEFRNINEDIAADIEYCKIKRPLLYQEFFKWYLNDIFITTYYGLSGLLNGYANMPYLENYHGVSLNSRLTNTVAKCILKNVRREVYYKNGRKVKGRVLSAQEDIDYKFEVSNNFINYTYSDLQRDATAHEWIHAICPPGEGHGPKFKKYMYFLNSTGSFNISVYEDEDRLDSEMLSIRAEAARYIMRCKNCGTEIYQQRMSKFIQYPGRYRCSKCKGAFERIK